MVSALADTYIIELLPRHRVGTLTPVAKWWASDDPCRICSPDYHPPSAESTQFRLKKWKEGKLEEPANIRLCMRHAREEGLLW